MPLMPPFFFDYFRQLFSFRRHFAPLFISCHAAAIIFASFSGAIAASASSCRTARHATRCPPQALRAAFSIVAATLFRLRRRRFRHHFRRHADYAFFIAATLAFFAASLLRRLLIRRHSFSRRRHYFV
jgi:hypothetical protein